MLTWALAWMNVKCKNEALMMVSMLLFMVSILGDVAIVFEIIEAIQQQY